MLFTRKLVVRTKSNPGAVGGGGRPRRTAWCASILLVVTTLVTLNIVGVILRSAVERETTDQTYRRQMMARFYRGDPVELQDGDEESEREVELKSFSKTRVGIANSTPTDEQVYIILVNTTIKYDNTHSSMDPSTQNRVFVAECHVLHVLRQSDPYMGT